MKGYNPSSTAPSDVHCCICQKAIPENIVADWLWRFNAMPPNPTCGRECAEKWVPETGA